MAEPIDSLIFALDADLAPYRAKLAAAEGDAASAGQKVGAAFSNSVGTAASQVGEQAGQIQEHLRRTGAAADELSSHSSRARFEIIMLGRELASGNFTTVPFTMARIGLGLAGV